MSGSLSRLLALAGLLALALLVALPPTPLRIIATLPLVLLFLVGLPPLRYWAIATASVMLPYFCWGVMWIVTEPDARAGAVRFAMLTIATFLLALDSMRRR